MPTIYSLRDSDDKSYTYNIRQKNAREFIKYMGWNHKDYRKCKSSVSNYKHQDRDVLPYKIDVNRFRYYKSKSKKTFYENNIKAWCERNIQNAYYNDTLCVLDYNMNMIRNINLRQKVLFYTLIFSLYSKHFYKNKFFKFNNSLPQLIDLDDSWFSSYHKIPKNKFSGNISLNKVIDQLIEDKKTYGSEYVKQLPKKIVVITSEYYNENTETIFNKIKDAFGDEYVNQLQIIWWNVTSHYQAEIDKNKFIVDVYGTNHSTIKKIFKNDYINKSIESKFIEFVETF